MEPLPFALFARGWDTHAGESVSRCGGRGAVPERRSQKPADA